MKIRSSFLLCLAVAAIANQASAQLIESWENSANGWQISSFGSQAGNFQIASFSNTTGVTDGSYSMAVGPTANNTSNGPNYSQLLISDNSASTSPPGDAYSLNVTSVLSNASALSFDVFTPSGSFGGFLQFDVDLNNSALGFVSLDGFSYPSVTIGSESTISVPITAAQRATLAGSGTGTTIILQVGGGFTAGNETFYIDNLPLSPNPLRSRCWVLVASV